MINELDLIAKFHSIGIDTCFNVKCELLGRNCDFLVVTAGYCSLLGGYWWLLLVTAR